MAQRLPLWSQRDSLENTDIFCYEYMRLWVLVCIQSVKKDGICGNNETYLSSARSWRFTIQHEMTLREAMEIVSKIVDNTVNSSLQRVHWVINSVVLRKICIFSPLSGSISSGNWALSTCFRRDRLAPCLIMHYWNHVTISTNGRGGNQRGSRWGLDCVWLRSRFGKFWRDNRDTYICLFW